MIKLLIYEDDSLLLEQLTLFLKSTGELDVAGSFGNTDTIEIDLKTLQPQVVLMDIDLPGCNGIDSVRRLRTVSDTVQVLMFTVFEDEENVFEALKAGANGYLLKKTPPQELAAAIKELHNGGSPMSGVIARKVLNSFKTIKPEETWTLTTREEEVLSLLVKGNSYKMIAGHFCISQNTVRNHIHNIYEKLHVNSATEAAYKAFRNKS
ncbi:MAG: response regulator transcription factor [Bacteroidota bacterium]|nr:response regulator transcription factor [Bacteroidota bacterium]